MGAIGKRKCNTFEMTSSKTFSSLRQSGLIPLRELTLAITPRCNLQCAHSWPDTGPGHIGSPVEKSTVQLTVRQWVDAGLGKVCLIVDKYPRTMEESTVPPGLIEVVKAATGQCRLTMIEVQRVA